MATNSILLKIASRLGRPTPSDDTLESEFARLKASASPTVAATLAGSSRAVFLTEAAANLFDIHPCNHPNDLLHRLSGAPLPLVLSPQPEVQQLDWARVKARYSDNHRIPCIGIVAAKAGIAETGAVAISSKDVPSGLLFLCDELIVTLAVEHIVALQDDLWRQFPTGQCRALHLIGGPSRTADVEQTLQVGAHGPRRVQLWLVEDAAATPASAQSEPIRR
jgi:L-lactate dehydrogenase complex protein LldG